VAARAANQQAETLGFYGDVKNNASGKCCNKGGRCFQIELQEQNLSFGQKDWK